MKTLITLLSVAALAACSTAPSKEDTLALLAESRLMTCEQLRIKISEYRALREYVRFEIVYREHDYRKCKE